MHPLKAAVLHHKLDEISELSVDPNVQTDQAFGRDLLRIACEMGNGYTITRIARLFPHIQGSIDARALLVERLRHLAYNYFGGGSPEEAAHRMWIQVTEGTVGPFSKEKPDFVLTTELKEDVKFLLLRCDITSEDMLVTLSKLAGRPNVNPSTRP
jgi:hypothetical protein